MYPYYYNLYTNMRKLNRFFYLGILIFLLPLSVMGQFERKVSVYANVGASAFSSTKAGTDANNALRAYKFSPNIGVAALYALDGHLSIGGSLRFLWGTKSKYTLLSNNLGAIIKYNILPSDKKLSPYVFFEGDLSYSSIKQATHTGSDTSGVTPSDQGASSVTINSKTITYSGQNVAVPAFGTFFGGGVDIKAKETLNLFVQVGYNITYLKGIQDIKHYYAANSNLSYLNISVGVRLNLFQKKSFY